MEMNKKTMNNAELLVVEVEKRTRAEIQLEQLKDKVLKIETLEELKEIKKELER